MNAPPFSRILVPALVGLALAPPAVARTYVITNHNKTVGDDWYLLVARSSTGDVTGPDAYEGEMPADAPPAKKVIRLPAGAQVRCTFGPEGGGHRPYRVVFYLYDKNLKNGSYRFIEGFTKASAEAVLIQQEIMTLEWEGGNADAVELRPMTGTISMNLPAWSTAGGMKVTLKAVDAAPFDSVARDMGDPRKKPAPSKSARPKLPESFVETKAEARPASPPRHRRQLSSISVWAQPEEAAPDGKYQVFNLSMDGDEADDIDKVLAEVDAVLATTPKKKPELP